MGARIGARRAAELKVGTRTPGTWHIHFVKVDCSFVLCFCLFTCLVSAVRLFSCLSFVFCFFHISGTWLIHLNHLRCLTDYLGPD